MMRAKHGLAAPAAQPVRGSIELSIDDMNNESGQYQGIHPETSGE